jgi:hypothetical protein
VFEKLPGDAKAALVSGNDCVPALLHAIGRQGSGGDDGAGAALVGACDALNAVITGLPKEAKQELLSGERGVVVVVREEELLENARAHARERAREREREKARGRERESERERARAREKERESHIYTD